MKLYELFKESTAVSQLKKDLKNPTGYDAIDHMMKTIAKDNDMTPKELHDKFVDETGEIPDDWAKNPSRSRLTETQKFDFEKRRPAIITFIDNVLNNKPNNREYNPFYYLIVGEPRAGAAKNLGISDELDDAWSKYFAGPGFVGGYPEPWSQVNLGNEFKKATGDNRSLNFYITVNKDKDNIGKFINNLYKLPDYLKPISQQYQTPIKFKTHSLLDSFIGHNDSLKIYYYDPRARDSVVDATRKWLSDSGITTGTRSHEHGVDIKGGGGSFGEILSKYIFDEFTILIKQHGKKYTPEQYFDWLKNNLANLIKQVKADEHRDVKENFADGKGPGRPGDSQRHGIPKNATMAELEKAAKSKGRRGQLARWQLNMRRGKKKK